MRYGLIFVFWISLCSTPSVWGWQARVIDVPDAETLTVQLFNGMVEHVRLYGIRTSKEGEPYMKEAWRFTAFSVYSDIVEVKPIDMEDEASNEIFGLVFMIRKANRFLNEELIRRGYAAVDHQSCTLPICSVWNQFQREAQEDRRGIWSELAPPTLRRYP